MNQILGKTNQTTQSKKVAMIILGVFFILSASTLNTFAQDKRPVEVIVDKDDHIAVRLAFKINEHIRSSKSLRTTTENENRLQMHLNTMNFESFIIFSVAWTFKNVDTSLPYYLSSNVGHVGIHILDEAALQLVAETDELINTLSKKISGIQE